MEEPMTPVPPEVSTQGVSSLGQTTATVLASVKGNGGAKVTEKGVCWSTAMNPTTADNKVSIDASPDVFMCTLTELTPNTAYYARAYATNSAGTGYGFQIFFQTHGEVPVPAMLDITTIGVTYISAGNAVSGVHIISDGGKPITEMGICWGTHGNPTTNDSKRSTSFGGEYLTIAMNGLKPLTTYYVRSFIINSAGTVYGNELSFTTPEVSPILFNDNLTYGSVSDIDGNIYKTIQIGSQLWMAENLKTTRLNDGTIIPEVTDNYDWGTLATPGYSWYLNDAASYKATYGALYNWYAVATNNLCPIGWHVPTETDFNTLTGYLGDASASKLIEIGNTHWLLSTYPDAINESGFTGLPAGSRNTDLSGWDPDVRFTGIEFYAGWWSATQTNSTNAQFVAIEIYWYEFPFISPYSESKNNGLYVRCVKN
jgi:uncharacterized protein (TIGR02145 family)